MLFILLFPFSFMALDLLSNALVSLFSLLWSALLFAIPVFLAVWLVGKGLLVFFQKHWHRSWIQSAFLASYGMFFVVLIIAFFWPVWQASRDSAFGLLPEAIAPTPTDLLGQFVFGLARILLISVFFALLSLPLIFVGEFFKDALKERVRNPPFRVFLAVWLVMVIALAIAFFLIPWVIPGLLYLVYWA